MEYSNLFVVLLGMGIVFLGLICIVFLIGIMGKITGKEKPKENVPVKQETAIPAVDAAAEAKKVQELVAVITCALAHELDVNPREIGIMSIKKL